MKGKQILWLKDFCLLDKYENYPINRSELKNVIKLHEHMLNDIYSLNKIKIKNSQLSFKVVDIQFQDEAFCRTNTNQG